MNFSRIATRSSSGRRPPIFFATGTYTYIISLSLSSCICVYVYMGVCSLALSMNTYMCVYVYMCDVYMCVCVCMLSPRRVGCRSCLFGHGELGRSHIALPLSLSLYVYVCVYTYICVYVRRIYRRGFTEFTREVIYGLGHLPL